MIRIARTLRTNRVTNSIILFAVAVYVLQRLESAFDTSYVSTIAWGIVAITVAVAGHRLFRAYDQRYVPAAFTKFIRVAWFVNVALVLNSLRYSVLTTVVLGVVLLIQTLELQMILDSKETHALLRNREVYGRMVASRG